ncbi:hypothetical protein AVEN_22492-1 [Araneus ventricosus]|uniref:Uncharacterized protein n=1 Tax=Araneus ventricosus TaxID=182803 RepID=A0A4Y2RF89_ARAVE|nr:hypothetical protein AVEN_22492-1 [Araneus ventricosus]
MAHDCFDMTGLWSQCLRVGFFALVVSGIRPVSLFVVFSDCMISSGIHHVLPMCSSTTTGVDDSGNFVPIYYLTKPLPRERAWQNQRGKKTLLNLTLG